MVQTDCPKCGSGKAWYEACDVDLSLKCRCGYHKVVYSTLKQLTIQHNTPRGKIRLPKTGTHLSKTLKCLSVMECANSAEVTQSLRDVGNDFTVSSVSSYLTILRSMGLVETPESKRGVLGGSTWNLTQPAKHLLGE